MHKRRRINVNTNCVADRYSASNERIVEFSSEAGGGLISFRVSDGRLRVQVYREDATVDVIGAAP